MPRVFGRGSRSQPAALVSDRDDAALFPAIRILERYGSAKSGRARRVRRLAADEATRSARPRSAVDPSGFELVLQKPDRAEFRIAATSAIATSARPSCGRRANAERAFAAGVQVLRD